MKQNSNFHSHCIFCDGRCHPEEFVRFAVSKKLRAYGFSSHSPLPFETFWNMPKDDMPDYLQEIQRLKEKYRDIIEIYTGLEIDFLDESYNASIQYFKDLPLDYRISSIHFIPCEYPLNEANMACIDGPYADFAAGVNRFFDGSIRRLTERFFQNSAFMVEAGGFDIVGHIDKIYMNGCKHPDFDIHASWYRKPLLELLDLIAEKGLIVEINCKYMTLKNQTFPHRDIFNELKIRNIPVMVNSDCHYPDLVNDGRQATIELLINSGFRSMREIVKGKWEDVSL